MDNVVNIKRDPPPPHPALKVPGVDRDAENDKVLVFSFSRRVTDDEMRFLHEVMRRTVAISLPSK